MNLDKYLLSMEEYQETCKRLGKKWCNLYKKDPKMKQIFLIYCDANTVDICFKLFYIDNMNAEDIAHNRNFDRRTVFKHIDAEVTNFGLWLDSCFNLYDIYKIYLNA